MHAIRLLGAILWVLAAHARAQSEPYNFGIAMEPLTRRQEGPIIVGRLPLASNGSVPHRLEIRQMRTNQHQWDLFILALSMFQSVSQDDPLSWYQVAGIHGVPFRTWNGVEPVPGANMSGYCPHGSVLFPTWHRPYLALVEQELYRLATFIATMFPNSVERRLYEEAASTIRLPYWDWALAAPPGQTQLPDVFWQPTIIQYGPRGVQMIRNPLYSYKFHPVEDGALVWAPFSIWDETKRAPAINISLASPPSINDEVDKALRRELPEIQERLFTVLTTYKEFNSFGTTAWALLQNEDEDSIEAIHNLVHTNAGLNGHMSFVPLSSFDPLFFMHHAAMDRFIAMWQVLNPNAWIIPMEAMETSYTTNKGTIHTSRTPLTPFYISENGTFWDSDMARSTITFGYAYAETDPSIVARTELHAEYLRRSIGAWYSDSRSKALQDTGDEFKSAFRQSWTNGTPCSLRDCKPNITEDAKDPPRRAIIKESSWREEWTIGVIVNANALERPYIIHFYLGKMPSTCRHSGGPNSIGSLSFMSMRMPGDVGDTGEEHKYKQAASTPITSALVKLVEVGYIKNLDANAVEPLLREALHFQICTYASAENTYSYTKVDPRSVGGLYIRITSTNRTVMQSDNKVRQWEPRVTRLNLFGSFPG